MSEFETEKDQRELAEELARPIRKKAVAALTKKRKLISNLEGDIERHGDPAQWKKYGDLLLANVSTAKRHDDYLQVIDYFADGTPEILIEAEPLRSISDVAADYFKRYTKARNSLTVIQQRLAKARAEADAALAVVAAIDDEIATGNIAAITRRAEKPRTAPVSKKRKVEVDFKGARRFTSSDGFEVLVGKRSADNDFLTFRIAKSLDTWLHAADYPGSHVVIRSSGKKEMPMRTLLEAAELAAYYSDAREMPKAAVNYTLKKFVNKPKRSAPGLVSLSSFKTVLVEPRIPDLEK